MKQFSAFKRKFFFSSEILTIYTPYKFKFVVKYIFDIDRPLLYLFLLSCWFKFEKIIVISVDNFGYHLPANSLEEEKESPSKRVVVNFWMNL